MQSQEIPTTCPDSTSPRTSPNSLDSDHHLGDIFLPLKTHCVLPSKFDNPSQRIFLTANGNLQRLLSSFYNNPVSVNIIKNTQIYPKTDSLDNNNNENNNNNDDDNNAGNLVFDRHVNLVCRDKVVCTANSIVYIKSQRAKDLISTVGIGQLFRYINVFPEFDLLSADCYPDSSFSRSYVLKTVDLECHINELFHPGILEPGFLD